MKLHFAVVVVMLHKLVAYFFEEGNRAGIIVLDFGNDVVPPIHCETE